jgi:hypothetical protein
MANHSRNKHTHTDIQNTTVSFLLFFLKKRKLSERARERKRGEKSVRFMHAKYNIKIHGPFK